MSSTERLGPKSQASLTCRRGDFYNEPQSKKIKQVQERSTLVYARPFEPLRRRKYRYESADLESANIDKVYQHAHGKSNSTRNPMLSRTSPILPIEQSAPIPEIKRPKKSKRPESSNSHNSQDSFENLYLLIAGVCTVIISIAYGLYELFINQTASPKQNTEDAQQTEPLITDPSNLNSRPFLESRMTNLDYLNAAHNPHFMKNLKTLATEYSIEGVRPIRGDGNCYYRSVMFGLLEQVIQKSPAERRSRLELINNEFKKIPNQTDAHRVFIRHLESAIKGNIWKSVRELETSFLDKGFDAAMVRSSRDLLALWIRNNKATEFNGLSLELSLPSDLESFIRETVTPEGVCAQGSPVDLGALGLILGFKINLHIVPEDKGSGVSKIENTPTQKATEEVNLVLRPGHYDLLYKSKPVKATTTKSLFSWEPSKSVGVSKSLDSIKENCLSPESPLSTQTAAQIDKLKSAPYNISKWRPIDGDGNCYYRAVMFGAIEQIIKTGNRERFSDFAKVFQGVTSLLPGGHKKAHIDFIGNLKAAASGFKWNTLEEFKADLSSDLDRSMIRAARYLISGHLKGLTQLPSGLTPSEAVGGDNQLLGYYRNIETLGEYAEGPHVNMGLLGKLLNFSLTSYAASQLDLFTLKEETTSTSQENEKVFILLVDEKQHYVLVYPRSSR